MAGKQVIVLVIDALPVEDFTGPGWPHLRRLAARGGMIGLMNARTAGPTTPAAAHATLGAGARARAGAASGLAFDADAQFQGRPAAELYSALTGLDAAGEAVLFLGLAELAAQNGDLPDRVAPGALGQAVRDAGGRTAAIGNADTHEAFRRHGVLLAMDRRGTVSLGAVGRETLLSDPHWPFGWRTDYDRLWDAFAAAAPAANFIVIELGDLARLDAAAELIPPARLATLRQQAREGMDGFIGRLAAWAENRAGPAGDAFLLVVSPTPPATALRHNFLLTPIAWIPLGNAGAAADQAAGAAGPLLASSPTTRRAGIVTNTDVAPTLLAALGIPPPSAMTGRPLAGVSLAALARDGPPTAPRPADPWEAVALIYQRAVAVHRLRPPIVRTFIGLAIAVFVGWSGWLAAAALLGVPGPETRRTWWRWVLLVLLAAPLSLLLLPLLLPRAALAPPPTAMAGAGLLAAVLAALAAAAGRRQEIASFILLSLATVLALVWDTVRGAPLIKSSVLGYDPITGARFYGIGNEYMGVLIGTALVGTTGLLDLMPRRPWLRWAVIGLYALVAAVLAAPSLGVNVGGTIAAVSGFAVASLLLWRLRLGWRQGLLAAGLVLGAVAGAAAADLALHPDQPSHLGRAAELLLAGDWTALGHIAARKVQLNVRLLRWTIWAQVLVVSLGITAVALHRPGALIQRLEQRHPYLVRGIRGAAVASLVALAANDSGVVAAATAMIPATATLLYLVLLDRGFRL
ncbi:MAG TPA: hypothetical protein VKZ69_05035 [Limnochordales bacterium]|nr:hypothetical protein [Limnochordales bacterium]